MGRYGEEEVFLRSGTDVDVVVLPFQVPDVKKPLLAVRRLVDKGNVVIDVRARGRPKLHIYMYNVRTGN